MTLWKLQEQGLREVFSGSLIISFTEQNYIMQGEYSLTVPYCGGERGAGPFSDLASPEVAPDKTHLRPQEHQRSAGYMDIISFCAPPTKFGLQLGAGRPPKAALEPQDSWP